MQSWDRILDDLPCDRKERASLDRFLKTPESQGFLPVYEILKRKEYPQEAFELLVWGHRKFPNYGAARAILGRELYERGLIQEARETLESELATLNDNILAQKILFKSAVLCGETSKADQVWQNLKIRDQEEPEISRLINKMKIDGLENVQNVLLKEFSLRGIDLPLPSKVILSPETDHRNDLRPPNQILELGNLSGLDGFQTLTLSEVFRSKLCEPLQTHGSFSENDMLEDRTLAEIYRKQGLLKEAIECYKRILISSPNNDHAKRSILQLQEGTSNKNDKNGRLRKPSFARDRQDKVNNQSLYEAMLNKLESSEGPR